MAKFGCKLTALRLEDIPNNDPRSFGDEQASLGCALTACSSTDEYDFPFEAIHFVLHLPFETGVDRGGALPVGEDGARLDGHGKVTGADRADAAHPLIRSRWSN